MKELDLERSRRFGGFANRLPGISSLLIERIANYHATKRDHAFPSTTAPTILRRTVRAKRAAGRVQRPVPTTTAKKHDCCRKKRGGSIPQEVEIELRNRIPPRLVES